MSRLARGDADDEIPLECPVCFELPGTTPPESTSEMHSDEQGGVAVVTPCGHGPMCEECLYATLNYGPAAATSSSPSSSCTMSCPICRVPVESDMIFRVVAVTRNDSDDESQRRTRTTFRALLPGERVRKISPPPPGDVVKEEETNAAAAAAAAVPALAPAASDLRSGRIALHSAKLDALVDHLRAGFQTSNDDDNEHIPPRHAKAVVFSQWTHMLDLVGYVLERSNITFVRLDGSMSQQARQKKLKKFRNRPDIQVMVMSLKAGSLGLNLTCASLVVLLDPWWNPAVEDQAINRCHRIGQTRKVEVLRLIVNDTCEERMLTLQRMKSSLAQSVLEAGTLSSRANGSKMTMDDLKEFFS